MAELLNALQSVSGRQAYFLNVPGTDSASALSVVSFDATETMGAPNEVSIELTHPTQLSRVDYLNRDAVLMIVPDEKMEGWESIDFNWDTDCPGFITYGCDSALEAPPVDRPSQKSYKNFSQTLSTKKNFENVEVWGQSTKSAPSFFPDYRVTSAARDMHTGWSVGATYQVAAGMGGGWKATDFSGHIFDPDPDPDYIKEHFDPVRPMYCYRNGKRIRSIHQGYFNDHREKV